MRKLLLCTLAAVFVLGIAGTAAIAGKDFVAKPLQTIEATPMLVGPVTPNAACQVGNTNPPYWAISNSLIQTEAYKLVFDPATCYACQAGLRVTRVHMLLQVSEPTTLFMSADVEEAVYPQPWCPAPGPEWCVSSNYTVDLPGAGLWDIGLPIFCDCLPPIGQYLLGIHFGGYTSASGAVPDLITDWAPIYLCAAYNNYGLGWRDMAYYGWPGSLCMYADVECCSGPVPVEKHSWGEVKALYKN
jgi:hypothetical protein